jgi:hypothetical protein
MSNIANNAARERMYFMYRNIFPVTFALLPSNMNTDRAKAMMIAIALQESGFIHRRQIGGPALGFVQWEINGVSGVLNHRASRDHAVALCSMLSYSPLPDVVHPAIAHNDVLNFGFARLLLWTDPRPLPQEQETEESWNYYLRNWRPGKPHRHTWDSFYNEAWSVVKDGV